MRGECAMHILFYIIGIPLALCDRVNLQGGYNNGDDDDAEDTGGSCGT